MTPSRRVPAGRRPEGRPRADVTASGAGGAGDLPAAVVLARMSSSRLPGKVLTDIGGQSLLELVLERLAHCGAVGDVVVAPVVSSAETYRCVAVGGTTTSTSPMKKSSGMSVAAVLKATVVT